MSALSGWWPLLVLLVLLVVPGATGRAAAEGEPPAAELRPPGATAESPATAALRAVPVRARIRVDLGTVRVVGAFHGATPGTLMLDDGGAEPSKISLQAVRGLELSKGHESRALAGLGWGLLAGTAVGVVGTFALGPGGDEDDYFPEYTIPPPMAVGALVGLVIGAMLSRERWEPVARW